jgi:hypothetical protein
MTKRHQTGPPRAGTLYRDKRGRPSSFSLTQVCVDIIERIHARVGYSRSEIVEHVLRQHGETTAFPATAKFPGERERIAHGDPLIG